MVGLFRFAGNNGRDFFTSFATPLPANILALCGRNRVLSLGQWEIADD